MDIWCKGIMTLIGMLKAWQAPPPTFSLLRAHTRKHLFTKHFLLLHPSIYLSHTTRAPFHTKPPDSVTHTPRHTHKHRLRIGVAAGDKSPTQRTMDRYKVHPPPTFALINHLDTIIHPILHRQQSQTSTLKLRPNYKTALWSNPHLVGNMSRSQLTSTSWFTTVRGHHDLAGKRPPNWHYITRTLSTLHVRTLLKLIFEALLPVYYLYYH